jgi:hypothetical protein
MIELLLACASALHCDPPTQAEITAVRAPN